MGASAATSEATGRVRGWGGFGRCPAAPGFAPLDACAAARAGGRWGCARDAAASSENTLCLVLRQLCKIKIVEGGSPCD